MKCGYRLSVYDKKFRSEEDGILMTEVLIVMPFLFLLAAGLLEFGNLFWQRAQIETGLRDAARYIARCPHAQNQCESTARNLAYFGTVDGTGNLRVPGWDANRSAISFNENEVGVPEGGSPGDGTYMVVTASTSHTFIHSLLLQALPFSEITIGAFHNQRVIGR